MNTELTSKYPKSSMSGNEPLRLFLVDIQSMYVQMTTTQAKPYPNNYDSSKARITAWPQHNG